MEFIRESVADNPGGVVGVATTSTLVLAARDGAIERTVVNDSDTKIYLRLAATGAVSGQGIPLLANGGSYRTDHYTGPICAIHAGTGTKNLCVTEV
jgi:hypothetical protein